VSAPLNIQEVTLFFVIFGSLTCYVTYLVDHQVLCQILPTQMMGLCKITSSKHNMQGTGNLTCTLSDQMSRSCLECPRLIKLVYLRSQSRGV